MKCKICKKKIEGEYQQVKLSYIHKGKCLDKFISEHMNKTKVRPKEPNKKTKRKVKKKTNAWYKKKATELAKELAKKRDNYTCQKCGKTRDTAQIHASHVYSTGSHNFLRADVQNIKALCAYHHLRWWHSNTIEAAEWFTKTFPKRREYLDNRIREYSNSVNKNINWKQVYEDLCKMQKEKT